MSTEVKVDVPAIITASRTESLALAEYRARPTKPERLYNFQEAHWNLNRLAAGLAQSDVVVADIPYSEDQMRKFTRKDFGLYLPEVFSTKEGLNLLGMVYPQMSWETQSIITEVTNEDKEGNPVELFGWMITEKSIDAPYRKTDEEGAIRVIGKRRGQTLNVYAEAGNQSKLLFGPYPDEDFTWVRVLNSRARGRVLHALFLPGGLCDVDWDLDSGDVVPLLGVRSVGVNL